VLLAALVLALAAPAAALAQTGNPFSPLPQAQSDTTAQAQTVPTTVTNTADDGGGLKRWQELLLFAGGLVLLAGIAFAIMRDARSRAPVGPEPATAAGAGRGSTHAQIKARNRARAKAARRARRRNR
jgi:hypothetical protein